MLLTGLKTQDQFVHHCTHNAAPHIRNALLSRWENTARAHAGPVYDGSRHANIEMREFADQEFFRLPSDASDEQRGAWAKRHARACGQLMAQPRRRLEAAYATGRQYAAYYGFKAPRPSPRHFLKGCIARLHCQRWWKRQARVIQERGNEHSARQLGLVSQRVSPYISEAGFLYWQERQVRLAAFLSELVATNEVGEEFTLAELAQKTTSNPTLRRNELMVRIRGCEDHANKRGHKVIFMTWTAPGNLHTVNSRTHRINRQGAACSPRDVQQRYFMKYWKRIRAALKRANVDYYGLRVVEPHHDGTPHWHLLLFVEPGRPLETLKRIIYRYALEQAPSERGAAEHRCVFEDIDPERGSATGYIAKYIAKSVDGFAVETAYLRGTQGEWLGSDRDPLTTAMLARAWASIWGIRQFQFLGSPSVTIWRELRRLDKIVDHALAEQLRQAADEGDWQRYIELMGGAGVENIKRPARTVKQTTGLLTDYDEPQTMPLVEIEGRTYQCRTHIWTIDHRPTTERLNGPIIFKPLSILSLQSQRAWGQLPPASTPLTFKRPAPFSYTPSTARALIEAHSLYKRLDKTLAAANDAGNGTLTEKTLIRENQIFSDPPRRDPICL